MAGHRRLAARAVAAAAALAAEANAQSEAPAAPRTTPQAVEQTQLARDAFATGTLARIDGALDADLWRRADPVRVGWLLDAAPSRPATPALGEALRRTLLTPGEAPPGAAASLGGRKLLVLARAGFGAEARTIASLSTAQRNDPFVGQAIATADLLDGSPEAACKRSAAITAQRDAPFWMKLRVFCDALAGEGDAADLSLALLREQGSLSDADDAFLNALASGVALTAPRAPETALHLAAARRLTMPLSFAILDEADAGVVAAVARDASQPPALRVEAAEAAAAMGAIAAAELIALFDGIEIAEGDPALARAAPSDPLAQVAAYQSIRAMTAPEFLRDKAARIAEEVARADSFAGAYAAAILYAEEIAAMEGAILPPREAAAFALARMALGDGDGAARWLFSMVSQGGAAALPESETLDLIDLVNLLAVLDPISAKAVAEAAGVSIDPRSVRPTPSVGAATAADGEALAKIIESAFDAAVDKAPGQAALAALAVSKLRGADDPVGRVVISQSLRAAGLSDLRRRMDFEAVWRARFAEAPRAAAPALTPAAATRAGPGPGPSPSARPTFAPRLKPKRAGEG